MPENLAPSGSLRNRLALTLIGGAAILALLVFFIVRNYAAQVAQQSQDNILNASATAILDAASIRDGEVQIDIPYAAFSMLSTPADDRVFYALYENDELLTGYEGLATPQNSNDRQNSFQTIEFQDEFVRTVAATRTLIGADKRIHLQVVLAQTQSALSQTLAQISSNAAMLGLGFFGLAAVLSFLATTSTIGQLKRLTTSVTRRGPQDLRPFEKPVPTEMLPLVSSLNSLMARLETSLAQSEDFIAEAAHRVRTPLATVRSYAEATLHRVEKEENRDAMRAMVRAIDESSRAAGQLLDHAMITFRADRLEKQDFDLRELVEDLVTRLTPVAEMKHLEIRLTSEEAVFCAGDPILVQNAVRNLIDNALKYSNPESLIEISVTSQPGVKVEICDRGPGFGGGNFDTLTNRFERGKNADKTIGSGLGLTIAKDVALAHGGGLTLTNRKGGGSCVIFSL